MNDKSSFEKLAEAQQSFVQAVAEALKLDKVVGWISGRIAELERRRELNKKLNNLIDPTFLERATRNND